MEPYLGEDFGNPSGIHAWSRRAKNALEEARDRAAALLGANHPLDVVFTGGGTESDNLGVAGPVLGSASERGVVVSAVEHEAVLETAAFLQRLGRPMRIAGVDRDGRVDPEGVAALVGPDVAVVSVMAANNETGARQDVRGVARAVKAAVPGVLVHTDAVQAAVSEEVTIDGLGVDLLTLASHKLGGPKGVGILVASRDIRLEPVLHGGGQELGRRSGTHDVAGIVGMVAALEAAYADRERFRRDVSEARRRFEDSLVTSVSGLEVTARGDRLVQHSHLRFPGVSAESLLIRLDAVGVAASAGSACQSGAVGSSHVLRAMGIANPRAGQYVRFTFGWDTRPADGDDAARAVLGALEGLA
jgi:cysteine desulfurase